MSVHAADLVEIGEAAVGGLLSPCTLCSCTITCITPPAVLDARAPAPTHDHFATTRTDAAVGKVAGKCHNIALLVESDWGLAMAIVP